MKHPSKKKLWNFYEKFSSKVIFDAKNNEHFLFN